MKYAFFGEQNPNGGVIMAEIWRATGRTASGRNQWGDYDDSMPEPPIPALYGREKVQEAMAVMEPRTTQLDKKSGPVDGVSHTAITLFFRDWTVDIRLDDMVAFVDHRGEYGAWEQEGEAGTNNYVSPFTGVIGGREVFLARVRELR